MVLNNTSSIKQMDSLEEVTQPVVKFLLENYNPNTSIIITSERIVVVEDVLSIPHTNQFVGIDGFCLA